MKRAAIVIALVVILIAGAALTAGPGTLSVLDGVMGGGRGTARIREGVPFGTHGQKLDVWRPSGGAKTGLPVLVFWYGGGWVHGSRGAYAFAARAYAKAGYVVVMPDYRKVPDVRFPAFLQDGAEAVKWTRDHIAEAGGDPNRIAVAGHSAGAYTVAMLTLDQRWLKAEGVDPHIVKAAVGLCGPYDFYPFTAKRAIDAMQGVADPVMTQPIHFARADAAPMLLITAGDDTQVKPHNAINLTARLKALGAPVMHIDYPGLSHENVVMALSKPFRGKAPVLADSVAFLNRAMLPSRHPDESQDPGYHAPPSVTLDPDFRQDDGGRGAWSSLYPREGGDPVWAPAFAGEQSSLPRMRRVVLRPKITYNLGLAPHFG